MTLLKNDQLRTSIGSIRRKAIKLSDADLVNEQLLTEDSKLPLVIQPTVNALKLSDWLRQHSDSISRKLLEHGTILFRGFQLEDIEDFRQCVGILSGGAIEYRFRASPRSEVSEHVYTSTDYPADQSIFPHNEHAFSPIVPQHLYLHCVKSAEVGGETPLGDGRALLERIDPAVVKRFIDKGVLYVRNYGDGFGLPWPTVFNSQDKSKVESYCASAGIQVEWKPGDRLRTRQVGPAVIKHPETGEIIWFNHATFFHITTLDENIRCRLLEEYAELDLPQNTYYGDGSPIETDVMEHLRAIYQSLMREFPWQAGDVALLDNLSTLHGRKPFQGERKVVVAMAKPVRCSDLARRN